MYTYMHMKFVQLYCPLLLYNFLQWSNPLRCHPDQPKSGGGKAEVGRKDGRASAFRPRILISKKNSCEPDFFTRKI